MKSQVIDNSNLSAKVYFRRKYITNFDNVLNCFAGFNLIYKNIKCNITNIDVRPIHNLVGDNRKYLLGLDLSKFDVIDLDAYGIPYDQLEIIFNKNYQGKIFYTFIQASFGALPIKLLEKVGYSRKMIIKIPTLFNKKGHEIFKRYLTLHGIKHIIYYQNNRKFYGYFEIKNPV